MERLHKGFTAIEIVVVLAIMVLLSGVYYLSINKSISLPEKKNSIKTNTSSVTSKSVAPVSFAPEGSTDVSGMTFYFHKDSALYTTDKFTTSIDGCKDVSSVTSGRPKLDLVFVDTPNLARIYL